MDDNAKENILSNIRSILRLTLFLWVLAVIATLSYTSIKSYYLTYIVNSSQADTVSNTYYVSPTGNDSYPGTLSQPFKTIQHAANIIAPGDQVQIRSGTYNEQVIVSKTNTSGNYFTFSAYPGETVTIDGTGIKPNSWGGLFEIRSNYVKIIGLHLINSYWFGFYMSDSVKASHIIIQNNTTYSTKSSGIYANSASYITVDGNDIQQANKGGCSQECITLESVTNFEVSNNQVHNGTGWSESCKGGEGIDVKVSSSNGSVHHNKVYDLPGEVGIYIDGYSGSLHDVSVYNNSSSAPDGIVVSTEQGGQASNVNIFNNLVYNNEYAGIWITDWMGGAKEGAKGNIQILNNTIYNAAGVGLKVSAKKYISTSSLITINNNLLYKNGSGISASGQVSQNNNFVGDPKFVSTDPNNTDFLKLSSTSPAIDFGIPTFAPSNDYAGINRPQGNGYDAGAYEYDNGTAPITNPTTTPQPPTSTPIPTKTPTPTPTIRLTLIPTPTTMLITKTPTPTSIYGKTMTISSIQPSYSILGSNITLKGLFKVINSTTKLGVSSANVYVTAKSPSGIIYYKNGITNSSGIVNLYGPVTEKGVYSITVTKVSKRGYSYQPTIVTAIINVK
jgi:hypothetical protein